MMNEPRANPNPSQCSSPSQCSNTSQRDQHYGTVTCTSTPEFDHITAFHQYDVTDISRGGYQIIDDTGEKVWYGLMNFEIPSMVG